MFSPCSQKQAVIGFFADPIDFFIDDMQYWISMKFEVNYRGIALLLLEYIYVCRICISASLS